MQNACVWVNQSRHEPSLHIEVDYSSELYSFAMQFDNIDCPNSSMMTSMTSVKDKMSMKYGPHLYLCTRSYDNDVKVIEDITPVPAPEKEVALVHAPEKAKEKVVTPNRRQRISRLGHSMFAQDRPVVAPRTWAH